MSAAPTGDAILPSRSEPDWHDFNQRGACDPFSQLRKGAWLPRSFTLSLVTPSRHVVAPGAPQLQRRRLVRRWKFQRRRNCQPSTTKFCGCEPHRRLKREQNRNPKVTHGQAFLSTPIVNLESGLASPPFADRCFELAHWIHFLLAESE